MPDTPRTDPTGSQPRDTPKGGTGNGSDSDQSSKSPSEGATTAGEDSGQRIKRPALYPYLHGAGKMAVVEEALRSDLDTSERRDGAKNSPAERSDESSSSDNEQVEERVELAERVRLIAYLLEEDRANSPHDVADLLRAADLLSHAEERGLQITDEAILAVAQMLYRNEGSQGHPRRPTWRQTSSDTREEFWGEAKDLLQAALPHLRPKRNAIEREI